MFDWKTFEDVLLSRAHAALLSLKDQLDGHELYAVAFHHSYREEDGPIYLPVLAANCLVALEGKSDVKWNPPDWRWEEVQYFNGALNECGASLCKEANRGSQAHWRKIEKRYMNSVTKVAKKLYGLLKKESFVTKDFVVFFDDEQAGIDLIRKTIPKKLFLKHFPEYDEDLQERNRVESLPLSERIDYLISRLDQYDGISREDAEEWLKRLGEPAALALMTKLKDKEIGWNAASLIGNIGLVRTEIVEALRKAVVDSKQPDANRRWSATTLGIFGDSDYLFSLCSTKDTQKYGVEGIASRYLAWINYSTLDQQLDYRPLDRLLKDGNRKSRRLVEEKLALGRSYCVIDAGDVDEAIRGLRSSHFLIRQHAVCILGNRALGKSIGQRVLPLLVDTFKDKSPILRRLALLSASCWKREARSFRSEIEKLLKDKSVDVRELAQMIIEEI